MTAQELLLLNIANAALGIVTLVFFVMIGWAAVREIAMRVRSRSTADDHAFAIDGLGLTMADGGEKVAGKADKKKKS